MRKLNTDEPWGRLNDHLSFNRPQGLKDWGVARQTALAVLDFQNPQIPIPLDLTGDIGVRLRFIDRIGTGRLQPCRPTIHCAYLAENPKGASAQILLDQNGSRVFVAFAGDGRSDSLHHACSDSRLDPEFGFETCFGHRRENAFLNGRLAGSMNFS